MRIIKPSVNLIFPRQIENPMKHIEKCARVCYKSENSVTEDSAKRMIKSLVKSGHFAAIEHYNFVVEIPRTLLKIISHETLKHFNITDSGRVLISGNARAFFEAYWNSIYTNQKNAIGSCIFEIIKKFDCAELFGERKIEHDESFKPKIVLQEDLEGYELIVHGWFTAHFVCDRGVSHEIVRHRIASYCQESTRYCVAGDMKLTTKNPHEKLTVKDFYDKKMGSENGAWKRIMIRQYDESSKELVFCKAKDVVFNGIKPCVKIKTKMGYELECTKDHKVMSDGGYVEAESLKVGSKVMVNGTEELYKNKDWLYHQSIELNKTFVQISKEFGFNVSTVKKWARKLGIPKKGTGYFNIGRVPFNKGIQIPAQVEAIKKYHHCGRRKDYILKEDTKKYRKHVEDKCLICGSEENLHVHHIDKNRENNKPENLVTLCASCHGRIHSQNLITAYLDEVVSVEDVGEKEVYDISMDSNSHNFVANGVVVHNCNYSKDKFGNDVTFILPLFFDTGMGTESNSDVYTEWKKACQSSEDSYLKLLSFGATPQEARTVLNNSVKTELYMTTTIERWLHFFDLRCDKAAHPQMREVAISALDMAWEEYPDIFYYTKARIYDK